MPPHSARAAGRTIFPPACSASARTTATSSGSNILREFDTGCALAPERSPEPQDHATSLEEADLLVRLLCAAPAHRLIKGSGPGQIADAKGYQTDALLHLASIAVDHELCHSVQWRTARHSRSRTGGDRLRRTAAARGKHCPCRDRGAQASALRPRSDFIATLPTWCLEARVPSSNDHRR